MLRRRMPRVTIRRLLALILVVGLAMGTIVPYRQYRRQVSRALMLVLPHGANVVDGDPLLETRPCWQARLIGDQRTGPVTALRFYGPATGAEVAQVAGFPDLELLFFHSMIAPKGEGLAPLAGLPSLRSLSLAFGGWDDSDLARLQGFRRLEELSIGDESFTDAGLAQLGELTGLRKFDLQSRNRADAGLAFLGRMTGLRSLSLDAPAATDAVLDSIRTLPRLERLTLHRVPITDAGLGRLAGLDRLEYLKIFQGKLDGRGLASLARLPRLRELVLSSVEGLKDEEMHHLRAVTQLRSLSFFGDCPLTEACRKGLKELTHLEDLKIVTANDGAWSDSAVGELIQALPKTRVAVDYHLASGKEGAWSTDVDEPTP